MTQMSFSFKVLLVAISTLLLGVAATCNGLVRQKAGPGGYGNSYHIGTRVPVNKFQASTSAFVYEPKEFKNQEARLLFNYVIKNGKIDYFVSFTTLLPPARTARIAWLDPKDHKADPLFIFDVISPVIGGTSQDCATLNSAFAYADITVQIL